MRTIPSDYVPPASSFSTFADGKYKVRGFEWTSKSEDGQPILVAQRDGRMVARLRFKLESGEEGPPYSLSISEVSQFVKALGGDVSALPPVPDLQYPAKVSLFLTKAQELSEAAASSVEVEVRDGWVKSVPGMEVPPGLYYMIMTDLFPVDPDTGDPVPRDGQFGKYFFVEFEIVAGEGGSETPFKGAKVRDLLNYSITVEGNEPDFAKTPQGAYTISATILAHVMQYTAPAMFEEGWVPSNPFNLLPDWLREARAAKKLVKAYRARDKKGRVVIQWETFSPVSGASSSPGSSSSESRSTAARHNVDMNGIAKTLLVEMLTLLAGGPACVSGTFQLTEVGKTAAREYLSPLKADGTIRSSSIDGLDFDQIKGAFDKIAPRVPEGKVDAFRRIYERLLGAGLGIVIEEF